MTWSDGKRPHGQLDGLILDRRRIAVAGGQ
jgi:hypothetical protein